MKRQAFLHFAADLEKIKAQRWDFDALSLADKKQFLLEILDKNLLYVPLSSLEDADFAVSEVDKKWTTAFYDLA